MTGYRHAFSLSKEEVKHATPIGTVTLIDHHLERTVSRRSDTLILVPEPTVEAKDPLNWPLWRKIIILWSISLYSFVANFTSAAIAPTLPILAQVLFPPRPIGELTHLVAVNVIMLGAANLFWVPFANVFGRRPVLLISTLILTLATMWCGLATLKFNSLLAARVIQGLGGAPADAVAPTVVGEIFFVHQRGRAMAVYTVFLALGPLVGGVAGGYIAGSLGLEYVSWIGTALSGASFLFILFFVPETLFKRPSPSICDGQDFSTSKTEKSSHVEHDERPVPKKLSITQSLSIGVYHSGLLTELARPYQALLFPGVWVVMLLYGGLVGGIVTMSTIGPTLVSMPPYLWGKDAGLINIGAVIGTVLGGLATYIVVDRRMKREAMKDSDGHTEPESRLPTLFPSLFIATTAFWVFGFCAANPGPKLWVGMEFGYGMLSFGLMQIPSVGFNYVLDSYPTISGDCFTIIVAFRAIISFAWTFFVGEWVQARGPAEPFGIFGMLMGIFSLLVIPQYVFGKRTRIATEKLLPKA